MSFPIVPGYTLESRLGRGAFGTVYRARWDGNYLCAVKVLEEGALHVPYLGTVLEKLQSLPDHPGLLRVHAFDLGGPVPHVSMALLPEGAVSFDDLSGRISDEEAWGLLRQLADALAWMHGHGLVHAGVTGGNVFVVRGEQGWPQALLADAGQAWLGDGAMERLHDQAAGVPPERWRDPGKVLKDGHAEAWDVYAFGVLAWRLVTGEWPRATGLFETVLASKAEGLSIDPPAFAAWLTREPAPRWPGREHSEWEKASRAVVLRCLEIDPAKRPASMTEVALVLRKCPPLRGGPVTAAGSALLLADAGDWPATLPRMGNRPPGGASVPTPFVPAARGPTPFVPAERNASEEARRAMPIAAPAPAQGHFPVWEKEGKWAEVGPVASEPPSADPPVPPAIPVSGPSLTASGMVTPGKKSGDVALEPESDHPAEGGSAEAPAPSAKKRSGKSSGEGSRRWLVEGMAALLIVGAAGYALSRKNESARLKVDLGKAERASELAVQRAAQQEADAVKLKKRVEEQRVREMAALRDRSAETVGQMLESAASETTSQEAWAAAAGPVADQLQEALTACDAVPALTASSMEARWQLANLYSALGRPDDSLPLLEHLARDFDTIAAIDPEQTEQWLLLKARSTARRGAILMDRRKLMEAVPLLQQASVSFEQWLGKHPDRRDVARAYAVNSLLEGRALMERKQPDDSLTSLARVAGLLDKPEGKDFLKEDTFLLSDATAAQAMIADAAGDFQKAIELRTGMLQLLLAYDTKYKKSVPCRSRLTEGFLNLGKSLTAYGSPKDAIHAYRQAVQLLTELSAESPSDFSWNLQLARAYEDVAELIHTANPTPAGARDALEYGMGSATILMRLSGADPQDLALQLRLAASLVLVGELQMAAGDTEGVLTGLQQSADITTRLISEPVLSDADRRESVRLSARAWSAIASLQEKAGRKTDAVASYQKALDAWSGSSATDPAAGKMVASIREKLKKLQPAGT